MLISVARVMLVACDRRQRELAPLLRVVGEPVDYVLEVTESLAAHRSRLLDVIVVDGASVRDDESRGRLLRDAHQHEPRSTVVYLRASRTSELELHLAARWADDSIGPGPALGKRLRRRIQALALAPWRRSSALRTYAERLGDARLRVLPSVARRNAELHGHPLSLPRIIEENCAALGPSAASLIAYAFAEGSRVGVSTLHDRTEAICQDYLAELSHAMDAARVVDSMEAARLEGASCAVRVLRDVLRHTRDELVADRPA